MEGDLSLSMFPLMVEQVAHSEPTTAVNQSEETIAVDGIRMLPPREKLAGLRAFGDKFVGVIHRAVRRALRKHR